MLERSTVGALALPFLLAWSGDSPATPICPERSVLCETHAGRAAWRGGGFEGGAGGGGGLEGGAGGSGTLGAALLGSRDLGGELRGAAPADAAASAAGGALAVPASAVVPASMRGPASSDALARLADRPAGAHFQDIGDRVPGDGEAGPRVPAEGGAGPAIPEPAAFLAFAFGLLVVGAAGLRRLRSR